MPINGREPACSVSYKITIIKLQYYNNYFVYKFRQNSHIYSYYQYITINYCEKYGLHVIKLMAKVYLRDMRSGNGKFFSGVSLYAVDDSEKF